MNTPQKVSLNEARDQLLDLVTIASEGQEIIIVQDGKPLARLIAAGDVGVYGSHPPGQSEFSSDDEQLGWDANGWEDNA